MKVGGGNKTIGSKGTLRGVPSITESQLEWGWETKGKREGSVSVKEGRNKAVRTEQPHSKSVLGRNFF